MVMGIIKKAGTAKIAAAVALLFIASQPGLSVAKEKHYKPENHGYRHYQSGNHHYYYHGGHFYKPYSHGYVRIGHPYGLVIPSLPFAFTLLTIAGIEYYLCEGVYYRPANEGYVVVAPPANARIITPAPPQIETYPDESYSPSNAIVKTDLLNVRSGPSRSYGVVSVIRRGTGLTIIKSVSGWSNVILPGGGSGWVMTIHLDFEYPVPQG